MLICLRLLHLSNLTRYIRYLHHVNSSRLHTLMLCKMTTTTSCCVSRDTQHENWNENENDNETRYKNVIRADEKTSPEEGSIGKRRRTLIWRATDYGMKSRAGWPRDHRSSVAPPNDNQLTSLQHNHRHHHRASC